MRRFPALVGLFLPVTAGAVPPEMTLSGRLLDATGVPLHGSHQLTVSVYNDEDAVVPLWSEAITMTLDNGYFTADLGSLLAGTTISDEILESGSLWAGFAIDADDEATPRTALRSSPYARVAGVAQRVVGVVDATEVLVGGKTIIDDQGTFFGDVASGGLNTLGCVEGEVPLFDGVDWSCAPFSEPVAFADLVDVPEGIDDGDDDTLGTLSCNDEAVPHWDEPTATWVCSSDRVLTEDEVLEYVTDQPIDLHPGSTLDGVALVDESHTHPDPFTDLVGDCGEGWVPKADDGAWGCAPDDVLTETMVRDIIENGDPIDLPSGSTVDAEIIAVGQDSFASLAPQCVGGAVPKVNGGTWECGLDNVLTAAQVVAHIESYPQGIDLPALSSIEGQLLYPGPHTDAEDTVDFVETWPFPIDLPAGSMVDGETITTGEHPPDTFALLGASCGSDGMVPKTSGGVWACNTDTVLSTAQVITAVQSQAVNLAAGSTVGGASLLPAGMVAMFDTSCPSGWAAYAPLKGRFPRGEPTADSSSLGTGGSDDAVVVAHGHTTTGVAASAGSHTHDYSASTGAAGSHTHSFSATSGNSGTHTHDVSLGTTTAGDHTHGVSGSTSTDGSHEHSLEGYNDDYNCSGGPNWGIPRCGDNGGYLTAPQLTTTHSGSHSHSFSVTSASNGNHSHTVSGATASAGSHNHSVSGTTGSFADHTHSVSGTTDSGGAHTHTTSGTADSSGVSGVGANVPAYAEVVFCRKD